MRGAIEIRKALAHRHADQAAVMAIAPAVIGAGDGGRAIARSIEQAGAAVPADIVKPADRSIPVPHHQHALGSQIEGLVVARARYRVHVTDDLPARHQHPLDFEPGETRVAVDPGRQRMRLADKGVAVEIRRGLAGHGVLSDRVIWVFNLRCGHVAWQAALQQPAKYGIWLPIYADYIEIGRM